MSSPKLCSDLAKARYVWLLGSHTTGRLRWFKVLWQIKSISPISLSLKYWSPCLGLLPVVVFRPSHSSPLLKGFPGVFCQFYILPPLPVEVNFAFIFSIIYTIYNHNHLHYIQSFIYNHLHYVQSFVTSYFIMCSYTN